jgi:RHS repeat-associated protein
VAYTYDYAQRPLSATGTLGGTTTTYVSGATYLPFGPLTSVAFGNGTLEGRTFDSRYRLETLQLTNGVATLASYSYSYDLGDNVIQIADLSDPTFTRTFAYDDLNRLVTANTGTSLWGAGTFTYDGMGNMLTATLGADLRAFIYSDGNPRITSAVSNGMTTAPTYDPAGNELVGPQGAEPLPLAREYSVRNNLTRIELSRVPHCYTHNTPEGCVGGWGWSTTALENAFDGAGLRRMSRKSYTSGGFSDSTFYFYTPALEPLGEWSVDAGEFASEVIWFQGRPVASETANGTRLTFVDHLNTPTLQMNLSPAVTWRAEYKPYGGVYSMRSGAALEQLLRFPGQQVALVNADGDEESYNIFRWYRSGWGRYTQADPILNLAFASLLRQFNDDAPTPTFKRANWYGYASSNPLFYTDPLGLKVKNNTSCRIYVKPETGGDAVPVYPGSEYSGDQDGYADPCKFPNQVFKTPNGNDVTIGPDHAPGTSGGVKSTIAQMLIGGWKDQDWQKKLQKKNDFGWDELFKKSDPGKCLCCATK